jgi:hypothetical protein
MLNMPPYKVYTDSSKNEEARMFKNKGKVFAYDLHVPEYAQKIKVRRSEPGSLNVSPREPSGQQSYIRESGYSGL